MMTSEFKTIKLYRRSRLNLINHIGMCGCKQVKSGQIMCLYVSEGQEMCFTEHTDKSSSALSSATF